MTNPIENKIIEYFKRSGTTVIGVAWCDDLALIDCATYGDMVFVKQAFKKMGYKTGTPYKSIFSKYTTLPVNLVKEHENEPIFG